MGQKAGESGAQGNPVEGVQIGILKKEDFHFEGEKSTAKKEEAVGWYKKVEETYSVVFEMKLKSYTYR